MLSGEDQRRTKATQLPPKTIIFTTLVFKGFQYSLFDFLTTLKKYLSRSLKMLLFWQKSIVCDTVPDSLAFGEFGSVGWQQIKTRAPAWLVGN